jgi:ABC-type lipoprotein export system ATPase subunit
MPGRMDKSVAANQLVVQARGLVRRYRGEGGAVVEALRGVSFDLEAGAYLAVTGPSGCGKSTLLNLLAALDRPDEGGLRVAGVALESAGDAALTRFRRETVGIVFQFFNLLPTLTVEENVALPLRLRGVAAAARRERARELLAFVGLDGRRGHLPHQLSGGEMQRCAVARALVHRPALVIADEPTGNLDSAATGLVLDLLGEVHASGRAALVVVTHSPVVAAAAVRRLEMADGRVVGG